jgi:hypothetical protein
MVIPRLFLFEVEDQRWFPSSIRTYMTDYLSYVADRFDFYEPLTRPLEDLLDSTQSDQIVDLAAGSGGGWRLLLPRIKERIPHAKVICTDLFPPGQDSDDPSSASPEFWPQPVDARAVPDDLKGVRTMFLSFHHFKSKDAISILSNAVDKGQPIFIVEAQKRNLSHLIRFALSPLFVVLLTPQIRPFTLQRFIFTYLIPIIPLCVWWDGIVSVLRTFTPDELEGLANKADPSESFHWQVQNIEHQNVSLLVLTGQPS